MTRCLVLIRSHEPLQEGWRKRSFGPAGRLVEERVKVGGVRFDETYHPVRVLRRIGAGNDPPVASFRYGGVGPGDNYALRADFADQDAIARLRRDRGAEIVGVFADPAVSPFPSAYCGAAPIGATRDVARRLGVPALRRAGLTGAGVSVAVVDTGIDGSRIPVAGGWAPAPASRRAPTCSSRRGTAGPTAPTRGAARAIRAPGPRSRAPTPIPTSSPWPPSRSRTGAWAIRHRGPAGCTRVNPIWQASVTSRGRAFTPPTGAPRQRVRLPPEWRPRSASASPPTGWRRPSSRPWCRRPRAVWGATAGTTTGGTG